MTINNFDDHTVAHPFCVMCGKPSSTRCSQCKNVYYCGQEHSTQHRTKCTANDVAPNLPTFNAILFAANEGQPRMIKVPAENNSLILGPFSRATTQKWVDCMYPECTEPLGRTLTVLINDNYLNDGSPNNQAIANVTNGETFHSWRDHVLVLRKRSYYDKEWQDAVLEEDMPALVAYFKGYGSVTAQGPDAITPEFLQNMGFQAINL